MNNKSLSQNWLSDEASLQAMIRAGEVMRGDVVLEIGPGPGALTQKLVETANHVVAVEFDEHLASNLHVVVTANNLEAIHADILDFDPSKMPAGYKVVANIPYHITAKIIQKFLTASNPPKLMALLVQKEVAERVTADAGNMSVLSVSAQLYAEVTAKEVIPAELFVPPPKVDSQILQLRLRDKPLIDVQTDVFFRLVKAGFGERRKKLVNSLAGGLAISKQQAADLLRAAHISLDVRAQELDLLQWERLYRSYNDA